MTNGMDLKQLKTFICLAEAGSLSRASDRLRIAQPALSRHIKLLENEVGVALFRRHVRGMELTESGKELLTRVAGLVRQLEQSVSDVQSLHSQIKGSVTLGLMPTLTSVLAVRLVERVTRELPGVSLRLVEGYSVHLIEWLQRGDIDATFLYGPSGDFHFRTMEFLYEEIVLISPPGSLPDHGDTIDLETALKLPLALPSPHFGPRLAIENLAKKIGKSVEPSFDIDSYWLMKALVKAGTAHAFLPYSSVKNELEANEVETRHLAPHRGTRQLILGLPSDRTNTRATDHVIQMLKDEILAMVQSGEWQAQPASDLLQK